MTIYELKEFFHEKEIEISSKDKGGNKKEKTNCDFRNQKICWQNWRKSEMFP